MLHKYKWWVSAVTILMLTLVSIDLLAPANEVLTTKQPPLLPVTIVELHAERRQVNVQLPAVSQARWATQVAAAVEGRVIKLPKALEPGSLVKQNQLMLALQAIGYQAEATNAAKQLAEAKLALVKLKYEQTVAKKSGGHLANAYARLEPQIAVAKQAVKAATNALAYAQQRLADTKIQAPFPAIILQRYVTPGQWVQPGDQLFLIAASDSIDIKVEIPEHVWQQLGAFKSIQTATVVSSNDTTWPATTRYINPIRNEVTRQRSVVLKVNRPYNGEQRLLPDQQVMVHFQGPSQPQLFDAPASVLTQDGYVWTVDKQQLLRREAVTLMHQNIERVWVRFNKEPDKTRQIVIYPLGTMLDGQKIQPRSHHTG
ncbi:efflux RND transporter periplasmic adaptor subunit [Spartinivicinus poritis]|uniref:Efflux RND transporter periplasmic adaptor subunit n=1 Tax=Spartinivicinus poritis TaxID=2994640 RepID=A0ABT5UGR8_9GAMM|nr:efflux RND transporter periplasmic adaptor subunit [Spartinivicinus sp. A2-2]MDE1465405.1 efflux RND transporter periplasmic adaptor subunit [Spartinivicinus sp. A2-2]